MRTLSDIRSHFLDYFQQNQHTIVPSSRLIPDNDPTLLFTNAGMVQFKDIFTGKETRDYTRATTAQKCLRAGGKHNDLDNVGYTARHHTFFEMLGNFSFGDYFKEEAILYAWNFVTRELGLDRSRLLTTVYAEDEEAFTLWQKIAGITPIKIPTNDNFWAMGDTGPCGPCSEIFYDHGPHIPGGPPGSPDQDGDRFVEIWNLVFMQYEQTPTERLLLPKPSIDTGMGLERVAAVVQGVSDNYGIDLFQTLIRASQDLAKGKTSAHAHRVIADHIRGICFLIADGVVPSNEGRGYVLRRILRRAMRYGYQLGLSEPFLYQLVPVVVELMGHAYPELREAQAMVTYTIRLEEERFLKTLEQGMHILEEAVTKTQGVFPGETAFLLYDTYGFPLDLTQDFLKSHQQQVDLGAFDRCMQEQRERSRASWKGSGDAGTEELWLERTEPTEFVGYVHEVAQASVQGLLHNGAWVESAQPGDEVFLVCNQTPFYAESGGQQGDQGKITTESGAVLRVLDTQKKGRGVIAHHAMVEEGRIALQDSLILSIDSERRLGLRQHHSATHLLHGALRAILGPHVVQKGSLVAPDRLRFDFSHPKGLTAEEIRAIEGWINAIVLRAIPVQTEILSLEHAKDKGAMSLFGEKYGELVRVVSMGDVSIELCGGTHVNNTGSIGPCKIISESSVASGIRRIEAIVGTGTVERIYALEAECLAAKAETKQQWKAMHEEILVWQKQVLQVETPITIGDITVYTKMVNGVDPQVLRRSAAGYPPHALVVLASQMQDKVHCLVQVGKQLQLNAKELAEKASGLLEGSGGGGNASVAQSGGVVSPVAKFGSMEAFVRALL